MSKPIRLWKVPPVLSRHIFSYGNIGSAKTCKNLAIAQQYYELKYKIWDIYGGKRNEGAFWCLPNDDKTLWDIAEKETHEFTESGPKEYKVNLLYPCFLSKLPKKLPQSTDGRVKSKIFTIPITDLTLEDIKFAIGEVTSNNTIFFWEEIINNLDSKSTIEDVSFIIDNKMPKTKKDDAPIKNSSLYKIFLNSLMKEGLFATKHFDLNLDVIEEGKNKEVVSVLCLDYVPERFRLFIMAYMLRKIVDGLRTDHLHKKHLGLFREASDFMKQENTTEDRNSPIPLFRNFINRLARYGRDGFHIIMDTQSPKEVRGLIEGVEDLLIINEMPSPSDRESLCDPIRKDNRMTSAQYHALATLKIHEMCVVEKGQRAKILRRMFPPRSRYWKEGKGNFYTTWANEIDQWRNVGEDVEKIELMYKESVQRLAIKYLKVEKPEYVEEEEEELKEVKEKPNIIEEPKVQPEATPDNNSLLNEEYLKSLEKKRLRDEQKRKTRELAMEYGI